MIVTVNIDTNSEMSPRDEAVLNALAGRDWTPSGTDAPEPAKAPPAAKKSAAAKKAEKAAADTPSASERAAAPEPEVVTDPPAEEPDEELLEVAVARAAELLKSGRRDEVMEALGKAGGASRVSEIEAEYLPGFLQALAD